MWHHSPGTTVEHHNSPIVVPALNATAYKLKNEAFVCFLVNFSVKVVAAFPKIVSWFDV